MPVATSRRKKTARQNSSDIEDDQGTQRGRVHEDVDDDEDMPSVRVKEEKGKKKAKGKQPQPRQENASMNDEDDDEDEDDRIDIENFADQPLSRAEGQKIHGFQQDWALVVENMTQPASIINMAAGAMAEVEGEDAKEGLAELDQIMRGLLDVQALMEGHGKVLSDIMQSIHRGEEVTNPSAQYLSLVDDMNAEYDKKTSRMKYAKNKIYEDFKEAIWAADHEDAMPPITDFIPREDGDESDDDDDVVMGGVTQEYKCPLMMTILSDPYTSSVCKHSFSGDAIKEMFRGKRGQQKCPASGCSKSFSLSDCKPDPDLAKKVKAFQRRQKARERQQDSDADEVID